MSTINQPIRVSAADRRRLTSTLFAAHSLLIAAQVASFTLMPIIGVQLGGGDSAAGIPSTISMVGRALAGYPIGWLMDRLGRRLGLSLGYFVATIGGVISVFAIGWESFLGFCLGVGLMGVGRVGSEQARYVAAEIEVPTRRAKVIGLIVTAGIIGGVGGPLLVGPSDELFVRLGYGSHIGPYVLATLLGLISMLLIQLWLRPEPLLISQAMEEEVQAEQTKTTQPEPVDTGRTFAQILADERVRLAIFALLIGQFVMTWLMVIMPVHMSHHDHTTMAISWVIALHNAGMYAFSWCTGWIIDRIGRVTTILIGAFVLALSAIITPVSIGFGTLGTAMFLVGLGWNFSFVAGSSLLSDALSPSERGRVQGASESLIAVAGSAGSLGTGLAFAQGGVMAVSMIGLALSLALLIASLWYGRVQPRPITAG